MLASTRLRVLRAERAWNQYDTARRAKLSFNRYWRIEKGYTDPTPEERARLARAFGVSVDEVFPGGLVTTTTWRPGAGQ